LLAMRTWIELYPVPWARLHGRKYARAFDVGLREILCANWHSLG
jgi:hypothetical protein